jgi:putative oxidoreductase
MGLLFTASAVAGMMGKVPPPEPAAAQAFMGVLVSSGLLYLVKVLELLCGLALLSGFFVRLALLVLAPIIVNIAFFHVALDPSGLIVGVVLIALWVGNGMAYRADFLPLLRARD